MIKEGIVKQDEGKEWKNQVKHRNKRWNGDSKLDWDYRISASKTMKSYWNFTNLLSVTSKLSEMLNGSL